MNGLISGRDFAAMPRRCWRRCTEELPPDAEMPMWCAMFAPMGTKVDAFVCSLRWKVINAQIGWSFPVL